MATRPLDKVLLQKAQCLHYGHLLHNHEHGRRTRLHRFHQALWVIGGHEVKISCPKILDGRFCFRGVVSSPVAPILTDVLPGKIPVPVFHELCGIAGQARNPEEVLGDVLEAEQLVELWDDVRVESIALFDPEIELLQLVTSDEVTEAVVVCQSPGLPDLIARRTRPQDPQAVPEADRPGKRVAHGEHAVVISVLVVPFGSMLPGRAGFSVAKLVTDYLPKERVYVFDEAYVREELEFFQVPESDRTFVLEGLARIGVMPYVAEDGTTRLAKLGIHDGECWAEVIREASE